MNYFPSQPVPNEKRALPGELYQFQRANLEAEHPPAGDASNKVATTGWFQQELCGETLLPRIIQAAPLKIRVTQGTVNKPNGTDICAVEDTITPIGVTTNTTEYVFIRFSDCSPVVSTILPDPNEGFVLGRVIVGPTQIEDIIHTSNKLGWAPLEDPIFHGHVQTPHPPLKDSSNTVPTTQWVNQTIEDREEAIKQYSDAKDEDLKQEFKNSQDQFEDDVQNQLDQVFHNLHNDQNLLKEELKEDLDNLDSRVLVNEQDINELQNQLHKLGGGIDPALLPRVEHIGDLQIRVTEGFIPLPLYPEDVSCSGPNCKRYDELPLLRIDPQEEIPLDPIEGNCRCDDDDEDLPILPPPPYDIEESERQYCHIAPVSISIVGNSNGIDFPKKQIWVRYSDCTVVASETIPAAKQGYRLAEIITDDLTVTSIRYLAGLPEGRLAQHIAVGYGGQLVFIDP